MRYFVSNKWSLDSPIGEYVTMDRAFDEAAKASKATGSFGSIFFVWNWQDGKRRVRAFAHAGVSRWAMPCKKVDRDGWCPGSCLACGGIGHVEYRP